MGEKINVAISEYTSYPKKFKSYKWYKPLLVLLLTGAFYLLFCIAIVIVGSFFAGYYGYDLVGMLAGGYDTLDAFTPIGALVSLGSIAAFLPALLIANRIVNARPFSSYSSSRGGFNFVDFFKSFGAALVLVALPLTICTFIETPTKSDVKFTVAGIIFCAILCPLQCIAEEYVLRGFVMQTFGSWIKFPVIAIVLQAVLFALLHPYNLLGVATIFAMGIILGLCAYFTKGLEACSALHIANNMTSFFLTGFGIGAVTSEVSFKDFVSSILVFLLYLGFIILATKKFGWFSKVKKDDVEIFNAKIAAKNQVKPID